MKQSQEAISLSNINVEGLENERKAWHDFITEEFYQRADHLEQNPHLKGSPEYTNYIKKTENSFDQKIKQASAIYIKRIEETLNQPWKSVLAKANFSNLNDTVIIDRDPGKSAMERMRDEMAVGKSLHEKAKSSVHGLSLAGYIPIDQQFSKAGDTGRSEYFNKIIEKRFNQQKADIDDLEQMIVHKNNSQELTAKQQHRLAEILSHEPVAKTTLQDKHGRTIYGFRDGTDKPIFAYKDSAGILINEETKEKIPLSLKMEFKPIETLSYITGIEQDINGKFRLKKQRITGDHDQLAIGTKLARNATLEDKALSNDFGFADDVGHAVTTALIDETKFSSSVRHGQDAGGAGTKGSLTSDEMLSIAQVKDFSNFLANPKIKAIMESKLGGNPYPEDFSEGNYATYTANGRIMVAHNEQQIIDNYNSLEKEGYNIGINPRYGWMRDDNNKLKIDPEKISAQEFLKEIVKLEKTSPQDFSPEKRSEMIDQAHKLFQLNSLVSLIKLQENSPEKNASLSTSTTLLQNAEKNFISEYGLIPPTISAMVNQERRSAKIANITKTNSSLSSQKEELTPSPRGVSDLFSKISSLFSSNSRVSTINSDSVDLQQKEFQVSTKPTTTKETEQVSLSLKIKPKSKTPLIKRSSSVSSSMVVPYNSKTEKHDQRSIKHNL